MKIYPTYTVGVIEIVIRRDGAEVTAETLADDYAAAVAEIGRLREAMRNIAAALDETGYGGENVRKMIEICEGGKS